MKNFLSIKNKGLSEIFILVSLILTIITLSLYCVSGVTIFNPNLYQSVIISLSFAMILEIFTVIFNSKVVKYSTFILLLYSFIQYIYSQVTYIANVFVAIDNSSFSLPMIFIFIFYILSLGLTLAAAIISKNENYLLRGRVHETNIKE